MKRSTTILISAGAALAGKRSHYRRLAALTVRVTLLGMLCAAVYRCRTIARLLTWVS